MNSLKQYSRLAEAFWRTWLPKMYSELKRRGQLEEALRDAEARITAEIDDLRRHFVHQGLTTEQADARAWEIVRYRYAYLRSES